MVAMSFVDPVLVVDRDLEVAPDRALLDPAARRSVVVAFKRELSRIVRTLAPRGAEVHVRLVSDRTIAALNFRYKGVRGPTDVLAFPWHCDAMTLEEDVVLGSGDVAIGWCVAARQALGPGPRALTDELCRLAIHGVAHLCGHDHHTRRHARAMHREERRALRGSRIADVPRPYGVDV